MSTFSSAMSPILIKTCGDVLERYRRTLVSDEILFIYLLTIHTFIKTYKTL